METPYEILTAKRRGESLSEERVRQVVKGASDGSWTDAQLAAFLMAAMIRGLDAEETRHLTVSMLESGERWGLSAEAPTLGDKHSTGGVGDKVSLVLAPLLAACGLPVVMLTGRGLGHTAGTADKLDGVPGLDQALDRDRCLRLLDDVGMAVGIATGSIAPADRKLYALRDSTGTVESLPLITASILSKKLATGAAGIVFDVKVGEGAFLVEPDEARRLAGMLVETSGALGCPASALITDMSQPLGDWVGHDAELGEALATLEGGGPSELVEVVLALAVELAGLLGAGLGRGELESALAGGRGREQFSRWAAAQGGDWGWLAAPRLDRAPHEVVVEAPRSGVLARVATRRLGLLMVRAGAGRVRPDDEIDHGVSLRYRARLGREVEAGEELARVHLRREDAELEAAFRACFAVEDEGEAPALVRERIPSPTR